MAGRSMVSGSFTSTMGPYSADLTPATLQEFLQRNADKRANDALSAQLEQQRSQQSLAQRLAEQQLAQRAQDRAAQQQSQQNQKQAALTLQRERLGAGQQLQDSNNAAAKERLAAQLANQLTMQQNNASNQENSRDAALKRALMVAKAARTGTQNTL